jgi:glycosyltransferase involved in cell wall biosynthesis
MADVSDHQIPGYSIADRIFYNLFIPDGMLDWLPLAAAYAHWIIRHYRVEVVLTSSPPHSTHLLGVVLKRYKNVRWIVDFRDPWLDNVVRNRMLSLSPYRNTIEKRMEKWTLRQADGVIANTEANRGILLARHPQLDPKKVVTIPNGFDTGDLEQLPEIEAKSEKFVATFTGYLYPGMADAFLRAVAKLLHNEPGLAHKLKIQFIGQASPYYQQKMFSLSNGLFQVTQWLGPMSHRRAIAHLQSSDLLLCFNFPAQEAAGVVPSKLYEYFMMAKPILAVGPEGEAAALIRQARAGQAFAPHQEDEIASAIRHFMRCWENGGLKAELNQEYVQRFDRRLLAQKLAEQCNAYA